MNKLFNKSNNKIICLDYTGNELEPIYWDRIDELYKKRIFVTKYNLEKELTDANCLLLRHGATITKEIIDQAPKLKYIGILATGYGRIDIAYAAKKGITVCNIVGYSTDSVAEFVFGALIEHIRELERAKSQARIGDYSESTFQGYEIRNKKFGVIGMGKIGKRVAQIAQKGFDANISYWSKNRKKNLEKSIIRYQKLEALLQESDFISIHVAYTPETKEILNTKRIAIIKPGAVVVCFVQMEVIDIKALEKRLKKKDITFILDHADELSPTVAKNLSKYKNCIMYPPIGFITKEATQTKMKIFVENIENFLIGKPTNKVN